MLENIKKISIQTLVLFVNVCLVGVGALYFKNQQEKKDLANSAPVAAETVPVPIIDPIAEKAAQLEKIIEKNAAQKNSSASKSTGQITVQQPKTVTQTIPGGTQTVTVPVATPAKTTKKS